MLALGKQPQVELRMLLLGERGTLRGLGAIVRSIKQENRHRTAGQSPPRRLAAFSGFVPAGLLALDKRPEVLA